MSGQNSFRMTPLDEEVSREPIQIIKAALPYAPPSGQRFLSIFAKALELQNTISLMSNPQNAVSICSVQPEQAQPLEMLNNIRQFVSGETGEKIDELLNTLAMVQMLDLFNDTDQ